MEEVNGPLELGAISLEEIKQGAVTLDGIQQGGVTDDGTMISSLPLLFADGNPTCLERFTESQLEKFIPFMVKCSIGYHKGQEIAAPKWWPPDMSFSLSLKKPVYLDNACWLTLLKTLVCRCYTYHGCEFMLRYCTELSAVSSSMLKYVNGWDGTTLLYNKSSGKLMVTFRNENRNYDQSEFPRRSLLPKSQIPKPEIVLQPPAYGIYLCDNCDGKFDTLQDAKEHEKICCQEEPGVRTRSASPDDMFLNNQHSFLNYFGIKSVHPEEDSYNRGHADPKGKCKRRVTFIRSCVIPFSSPLGIFLHKTSKSGAINAQVLLERTERYCDGQLMNPKSRTREKEENEKSQDQMEWPTSWKPPLSKEAKESWTHMYCFSKSKRKRPYNGNSMGLNRNSQKLLARCRPLAVVLRRLTDEEITHHTERSPAPSSEEYSPFYTCRLPRLLPNIVYTCTEQGDGFGNFGIEPSTPLVHLCSIDNEEDESAEVEVCWAHNLEVRGS